jgi:hypothetical protein
MKLTHNTMNEALHFSSLEVVAPAPKGKRE